MNLELVVTRLDLLTARENLSHARKGLANANRMGAGKGVWLARVAKALRELGKACRQVELLLGREPRYRKNGMKRLGV